MPGELSLSLRLSSAVNITVRRANLGSLEIAHDVSALNTSGANDSNLITVSDPSDLEGLLSSPEEESEDNERLCVEHVLLLHLDQGLFEYHGDELTCILKYANHNDA